MSRYIKSAETLKARAGKQVKVNGEIFDVTVHTDTIAFDNEKNSFNVVNSPACIERFLCKNRVASAGYKFKHTSKAIEGFIFNKECRITLKPYVGNFDDASSQHTIVGMLLFCKDHCGDKGYMLLTNDEHLRGDPAADMKGYDWSWWLGYNKEDMEADVESTEPLESECNAVTQSGTEKTEEKEYSLLQCMGDEDSRKTVKGVIKEYKGISYLLSNDVDFDGGHPDATEGTGYKYGWWLCEGSDISKSGYAIREACAESAQTSDDFIVDKECNVTIKPETGDWKDEFHTVRGMLVKEGGDWYLLSNEKALDGSAPNDMKGYKYGWYLCEGSDLKSQHKVLGTVFDSVAGEVVEEVKKDPLVRIAMALEDIATYLSRMSK